MQTTTLSARIADHPATKPRIGPLDAHIGRKIRERRLMPGIAKAKRNEARHIGAKAPSRHPLPFGRGSKFKRKLDGTVVPR